MKINESVMLHENEVIIVTITKTDSVISIKPQKINDLSSHKNYLNETDDGDIDSGD